MALHDQTSPVERTQRMTDREKQASSGQTVSTRQTVPTRKIGPYELVDELGRGANGIVFLARRVGNEELLAVKVLLQQQDEEAVIRFRREAATTARIQAPGIVRTLDFGQDGSRLYYVMEYCPGETLKDKLRAGPLPAREAALLIAAMARAIAAAHQWGVIHRDLKPSNVLLEKESGRPRITDFGLARDYAQQRLTRTGDVLGTPVYMAPEQIHGRTDLDHRVDIYALGAMLYELLAGRVPFYAPDLATLAKQIESGRVEPLSGLVPSLSADLIAICARAMAVQRGDRFQTASAFADALEAYVANEPEPESQEAVEPASPTRGTPAWVWAALASTAMSCVVLSLVLVLRSGTEGAEGASAESLASVRAEAKAEAHRAEVRRVLQEVEIQQREGASAGTLIRQLARALEIATGPDARAVEAKLEAVETEIRALDEARSQLSELERRNERFVAVPELESALDEFARAHPTKLPEDLRKRFKRLKMKVAGRSILVDYVESMSDPPTFDQVQSLVQKASEWAPFSPALAKEACQHALRLTDGLLKAARGDPTLLVFRGLIQYRLGNPKEAAEGWRAALSGYPRDSRRGVVHEFMESGLLSEEEGRALREAVRGRR